MNSLLYNKLNVKVNSRANANKQYTILKRKFEADLLFKGINFVFWVIIMAGYIIKNEIMKDI